MNKKGIFFIAVFNTASSLAPHIPFVTKDSGIETRSRILSPLLGDEAGNGTGWSWDILNVQM